MRLTDIACMNDEFYYIKDSTNDQLDNLEDIEYELDINVPEWFKDDKKEPILGYAGHSGIFEKEYANEPGFIYGTYLDALKLYLNRYFGKDNYSIIDTSVGYHILVRTTAIKSNPNKFCEDINVLYKAAVHDFGKQEYVDEKGDIKSIKVKIN